MRLEPGMRVRCVDNNGMAFGLTVGQVYTISRCEEDFVWLQECTPYGGFMLSRFKPIVRVKMGRVVQ